LYRHRMYLPGFAERLSLALNHPPVWHNHRRHLA
jgi:hypothetical protein